jgi:hypothetical protein
MDNNVQIALDEFTDYVIKQSRANLTRKDKNVNRKLYNSLKGSARQLPNSIEIFFSMEEYGQYQDKGVKGKKSATKAPQSPFRFGSGTGRKGGLTENINKWVKQRRFQFKDKKSGKFMSYDSTAWLITRSIYNKGIKPSLFFTKPFEAAFKKLPTELVEKYGLDVQQQFIDIIKQP